MAIPHARHSASNGAQNVSTVSSPRSSRAQAPASPASGVVLPGRRPGLHLDDEGRRQADAAAQRLAKLPRIDAVYSSPLERARETAAPIARARGLSVRTERGLLEIDVGAWAGLKLDRARKKPEWAIVQRHATGFRFPNGESFLEMQTRVVGTLADLVARHPGRTLVAR